MSIHSRLLFSSLMEQPNYKQHSRQVEGLMRQKWFVKLPDMANYHMQLHYNLRMVSPTEVVYPTDNSLVRLNL